MLDMELSPKRKHLVVGFRKNFVIYDTNQNDLCS